MVEKKKFVESHHDLVLFDIKFMYTSGNTTRTINYIPATIFRNPKKYWKQEKDAKGYNLPIPTRAEFKDFLLGILQDFNYFDSQTGFYQQI